MKRPRSLNNLLELFEILIKDFIDDLKKNASTVFISSLKIQIQAHF